MEKHFASFEIQLNEIDKKFSERCGKLEADVSALDLNINRIGNLASEIETEMVSKFEILDEKLKAAEVKNNVLLQKIKSIKHENVMRESYDKQFNILIHGLDEIEHETKPQTKAIFETFLMEALGLEPDAVRIVDLHRFPQHPVTKAGKKVTRPIIVKVLTAFDKSIICENVNLKAYNDGKENTAFITDHLPKLFYKQKQMLMPDFKAAKGKKRTWGTYDGKYCLYVENKRILPPVGADYV